MTTQEINKAFAGTLAAWTNSLDSYSSEQFAKNPAAESWSMGQVCAHLIFSTKRVFLVIDKCLAGNANEKEQKTELGEKAFATNILSEVKVKLPPTVAPPPQEFENVDAVKKEFSEIRKNFAIVANKIDLNFTPGKEKHPVLGFMNAKEWLHTVEMHFRHHLKQKAELDLFLKGH
jgi:hypothetical protein